MNMKNLYKAVRLDNGEIIRGQLITIDNRSYIFVNCAKTKFKKYNDHCKCLMELVEVMGDSVKQNISRLDVNNEELYEDDECIYDNPRLSTSNSNKTLTIGTIKNIVTLDCGSISVSMHSYNSPMFKLYKANGGKK